MSQQNHPGNAEHVPQGQWYAGQGSANTPKTFPFGAEPEQQVGTPQTGSPYTEGQGAPYSDGYPQQSDQAYAQQPQSQWAPQSQDQWAPQPQGQWAPPVQPQSSYPTGGQHPDAGWSGASPQGQSHPEHDQSPYGAQGQAYEQANPYGAESQGYGSQGQAYGSQGQGYGQQPAQHHPSPYGEQPDAAWSPHAGASPSPYQAQTGQPAGPAQGEPEPRTQFNQQFQGIMDPHTGEVHQVPDLTHLQETDALLVVVSGPDAGAQILLDTDVVTVGRSPNADIFLDDVTVSRKHAEFVRTPSGFTLRDTGSLNGTYVGRQLIDSIELQNGADVQIGKFRMIFQQRPRVN